MRNDVVRFNQTCPHIAVVDNFLPSDAFERLKRSLTQIEIYPPGLEEFPGLVWRLGDTPPYISRYVHDRKREDANSPFVELASALSNLTLEVSGEQLSLSGFSSRLQVARAGMGLSCHYDGNDRYSGGYTFYLSEEWDPHWGGLLIAFDESPAGFVPSSGRFSLLDTDKERRIFEGTMLNCAVIPKPNRLVLLRNPIRHMVTPVLPSAGDRVRMACTGYFVCKPNGYSD
jgi:Rps23 Pro-64 3,4-dihydroxylase Tpa1-like proline 4-hydroxylase